MGADGQPTSFITLTVNPARGQSPDERAAELSNAWRLIAKRARRKFTKAPLEYLAIFEETKKGEPHLHILCRAPFIPQKWLSDQMQELMQAPIVDIRRVKSTAEAAKYVAKYAGKGPKPFATLKRYWSTPKYDLTRDSKSDDDKDSDKGWRIWKEPLCVIADIFRSNWRTVTEVSETEIYAANGSVNRRC